MEIGEVLDGENGVLPFTFLLFLSYHIWRAFSNTPP